MKTLEERLDQAEAMIQTTSFRENKGLGNEVGYYIFDYPPEQELYIRNWVEYIRQKNESSGDDYRIIVFDLYDIVIDILIQKDTWKSVTSLKRPKALKGFQSQSVIC